MSRVRWKLCKRKDSWDPIVPRLQLEYPIASSWQGGQLLGGYIDLVGSTQGLLRVIDFKTDAPPTGPVQQIYPEYNAQVRTYGRLIASSGLLGNRRLGCGLLFTADGGIRWAESEGLFSPCVAND
jgi:ATP-dependent helicase/nuclease subunit A